MDNLLYFGVFAVLFLVMMRFGCGSHVMGHAGRHGGHEDDPDRQRRTGRVPEATRDPVCGLEVQTGSAQSSVHDGGVYSFSASHCDASPGRSSGRQ